MHPSHLTVGAILPFNVLLCVKGFPSRQLQPQPLTMQDTAAVSSWNDSTSICQHNLLQASLKSRARHVCHSKRCSGKIQNHTGPLEAATAFSAKIQEAKQQSAVQLATLTAQYGIEAATAMQLMPTYSVRKAKTRDKVQDMT